MGEKLLCGAGVYDKLHFVEFTLSVAKCLFEMTINGL